MVELKKFTKYTLRICCGYAIIMRDVSFCIYEIWKDVSIMKKKTTKCYLYTRVSTSIQVEGYSLDAQRDKLRKYAAYEDMA